MKNNEKIINTAELKPLMEDYYLQYAVAVITDRAIPDIRDGLKPVQRRLLYGANELKMLSNTNFRKSAALVGDVMGKYHPHGDSSIYDAAVLMVQNFASRYPLLEGQGNFGSIDGDPAAAMRYSELRLSKNGEELLNTVNQDTVEMVLNFDEEHLEPSVLPSKIPNILINGTSGIAVAMSTSMASHNITEVANALELVANNEDVSTEDILSVMPGPDFPTGGIIRDSSGIKEYYETGIGKVPIESAWTLEKQGKYNLICFTEIPYSVNKSKLVQKIAQVINDDLISGLISVEDETNMDGIRIVVKAENTIDVEETVQMLFKKTALLSNFNVRNMALDEKGRPKIFSMKDILKSYLNHQINVYYKESENEIKKLDRQIKIATALIKASSQIKKVVDIIEKSPDTKIVKKKLMKLLDVDEESVEYILSLQLRRIQKIEKKKQEDELKKYQNERAEYQKRLDNSDYLKSLIIKYLKESAVKLDNGRQTKITDGEMKVVSSLKDILIMFNDEKLTVVDNDYVFKKSDEETFKGVLKTDTGATSLVVGKNGELSVLNNYGLIGDVTKYNNIGTVVKFDYNNNDENLYLFTQKGLVKAVSKELLIETISKKHEFTVVGIESDDEVIDGFMASPDDSVIAYNNGDKFMRAELQDVRPMGLTAKGIAFMKLSKDVDVVSVANTRDKRKLYYIDSKNNVEEIDLNTINVQKRAGQGRMLFGKKAAIPANFKNELFSVNSNKPTQIK